MFNSAILDVAIGLFLMYLILSMITTVIQEAIASVLQLRASTLFQGIENLLDDKAYQDLAERVYKHPAIYHFYKGEHKRWKKGFLSRDNGPAYIPSGMFVTALLDTLRDKDNILKVEDAPAGQVSTPVYLREPWGFTDLLRNSKNIVTSLPDGNLKTTLMLLVSDTESEIDAVKHRLEGWFDNAMDRVGGWYKRTAQGWAIAIGILMAFSLNADSIHVAVRLWQVQPLRAAVAEHAKAYVATLEAQRATAGSPAPAADQAAAAPESGAAAPAASRTATDQNINELFAELQTLPVGWTSNGLQDQQHPLKAMFGWILTGFAVSLGASFWFNTLGEALKLRATGKRIPTRLETGKTAPAPPA